MASYFRLYNTVMSQSLRDAQQWLCNANITKEKYTYTTTIFDVNRLHAN